MAVKFETVKAGDTLYSVFRQKMGNTTMSATVCLPVRIVEIDHEGGNALVSQNGNPARYMHRSQVERLRRTPYKARTAS